MAEWPADSSSVTSAVIVDGTIVDADVSDTAAIDVGKLSGVETPAGAQAKADAAEASAAATAAADATTKADAAQAAAEATAAGALTVHASDGTDVHGITDTSALVVTTDPRLTDSRTPTVHAASHATGGSDPVTPASIGAETQAGAQAKADAAQSAAEATAAGALTTHEADTSVHGIADTSALIVEGDPRLSDARTPTAHTHPPSEVTGTAVITTDPRLSDARTPTAHAASHGAGQADEVTPASIGAETQAGAQAKADAAQSAAEAYADGVAATAQSGAEATAAGALTAHEADTTSVHGITDTSVLELTSGAQAKADAAQAAAEATASTALTAHNADETGVHGITDTAGLALTDGSRAATYWRVQGPGDGTNIVKVTPTAATSASTSAGGAVNLDNTGNTGAGLVVYSNLGATAAGRLFVVRATNPAFPQQAVYVESAGTNHGVVINHLGTGAASLGLSVASTNQDDTTIGAVGSQTGRAVLKARHLYPGVSDVNAAVLTLSIEGAGTAAQGIFVDAPDGTTGKLLNIRVSGGEQLTLSPTGDLAVSGAVTSGGTAVVLDDDSRLTDARTPATHAASHAAGSSDHVSPASIAALGLGDERLRTVSRRWDFTVNPFIAALGEWTSIGGYLPVVSGGTAVPSTSSEENLSTTWATSSDVELAAKYSQTSFGSRYGLVVRRADPAAQTYIMVRPYLANAAVASVQIYKRVSGSFTLLKQVDAGGSFTAGADLWVVARAVGDTVVGELWLSDPSRGGVPLVSASYVLVGGDATSFGAGVAGRVGLRVAGFTDCPMDWLSVRPLTGRVTRRDVQVFTGSGTWVKPANAALDSTATARIVLVGGGGGGGSGPRVGAGVAASGGGAGSGGALTDVEVVVSALSASCSVVVGAGGTGGAPQTTDSSDGSPGTSGGKTYFLSDSTKDVIVKSHAGDLGAAGTIGAASSGGGNPSSTRYTIESRGGGGVSGAAGSSGTWATPGCTGGGAGGGLGTGTASFDGGTAGGSNITEQAPVSGGTSDGASGASGSSGAYNAVSAYGAYQAGYGGGGGASSEVGAGGAGGAGGSYGGGGGGGGASRNGNSSGAGGEGAPGVAVIETTWTEAG